MYVFTGITIIVVGLFYEDYGGAYHCWLQVTSPFSNLYPFSTGQILSRRKLILILVSMLDIHYYFSLSLLLLMRRLVREIQGYP